MATAYKPKSRKSKYWMIKYRLPNGKFKDVSSGLEDENLAKQMALKLEHASNLASKKSLSKKRVLDLLSEILALAGDNVLGDETVRVFADSYFDANKGRWSDATTRKYRSNKEEFYRFLGNRADSGMSLIDGATIAKYRDWRLKAGFARETVKNSMVFLKAAFSEATQQGIIPDNPFVGIKFPKKERDRNKKRAFSMDQFSNLCKATDGEWRIFILIAGYTGQRQQDCAKLKVNQILFDENLIKFIRKKNKDADSLPFETILHPYLKGELLKWVKQNKLSGDDYLYKGIAELPQTGAERALPHVFRFEVLPLIGIEQPYHASRGGPREVAEYSFHSFRHMYVTLLHNSGAGEKDKMDIVGHTTVDVSRGYTHKEVGHLLNVVSRVPGLE